jgi:RHS repeat-associated protein
MQGQYEDEETGLYYNRYRYYDPVISAYVSQDPLGLIAGENLYSYTKNSFGWIDPLGLSCKKSKEPSKINLTKDGVKHVKDRHVGNKEGWEHKSKWTESNADWKSKTRETFRNPDKVSKDGYRFVYEKEFKKPIGIDSNGNELNKVRVITESNGDLVTSFPQMNWK